MKTFIGKPLQAIQLNRQNIREIIESLPDSFVFYGINEDGIKEFGEKEELERYQKLGGYYYHKKEMKKIYYGDWIIKRKDEFDFINPDYFSKNFIEIFSFY